MTSSSSLFPGAIDDGDEEEEEEESTSDFFISTFLHDFPVSSVWRVLSADELLPYHGLQEDFSFIINLSIQSEPGTHFVVAARRGDNIYYLDSLKLGFFLTDHIPQFLTSFKSHCTLHTLKYAVQHLDSWYCGFFATNFVYMLNPETAHLPYAIFKDTDLLENDCLVINNLMLVLKHYWNKTP